MKVDEVDMVEEGVDGDEVEVEKMINVSKMIVFK